MVYCNMSETGSEQKTEVKVQKYDKCKCGNDKKVEYEVCYPCHVRTFTKECIRCSNPIDDRYVICFDCYWRPSA